MRSKPEAKKTPQAARMSSYDRYDVKDPPGAHKLIYSYIAIGLPLIEFRIMIDPASWNPIPGGCCPSSERLFRTLRRFRHVWNPDRMASKCMI